MRHVGVREFKNSLSHYLHRARAGEQIVVTDRGQAIAKLIPMNPSVISEKLSKLVQSGAAHWAGGKPQGSKRPIRIRGRKLSDLVIQGRQ